MPARTLKVEIEWVCDRCKLRLVVNGYLTPEKWETFRFGSHNVTLCPQCLGNVEQFILGA